MSERNDLIPFEEEIGKVRVRYASASSGELAELATVFPQPFVDHIRANGWCSYADQTFWTISPDYLAPAIEDWKLDEPVRVFGRNALGNVFAFCRNLVVILSTSGNTLVTAFDLLDFLNYGLSPDALRTDAKYLAKELGPLEWDECYTYVPALPFPSPGGRRAEKGKLLPYVSIIGQMVAPVRLADSLAAAMIPPEIRAEAMSDDLRAELLARAAVAEKEIEEERKRKGR